MAQILADRLGSLGYWGVYIYTSTHIKNNVIYLVSILMLQRTIWHLTHFWERCLLISGNFKWDLHRSIENALRNSVAFIPEQGQVGVWFENVVQKGWIREADTRVHAYTWASLPNPMAQGCFKAVCVCAVCFGVNGTYRGDRAQYRHINLRSENQHLESGPSLGIQCCWQPQNRKIN